MIGISGNIHLLIAKTNNLTRVQNLLISTIIIIIIIIIIGIVNW